MQDLRAARHSRQSTCTIIIGFIAGHSIVWCTTADGTPGAGSASLRLCTHGGTQHMHTLLLLLAQCQMSRYNSGQSVLMQRPAAGAIDNPQPLLLCDDMGQQQQQAGLPALSAQPPFQL